jgi:hypothetical protein
MAGVLNARLPELQLGEVIDPRSPRGRRWRSIGPHLRSMLVAMLSGATGLSAVEALTADLSRSMRRLLGIARRIADTSLRNVLVKLDLDSLRQVIYRQVRAAHRRHALGPHGLPFGVVSIDGKVTQLPCWDGRLISRQRSADKRSAFGLMRTLTAVLQSSRAKVCLDAMPYSARTNEGASLLRAVDALLQAYEHPYKLLPSPSTALTAAFYAGKTCRSTTMAAFCRLRNRLASSALGSVRNL